MELPDEVGDVFEVFVNGVPQQRGVDFDQVGRTLVFRRELAWRGGSASGAGSIFLGVAGTYRRNDTVDVVYTLDGQRTVASLEPHRWPA